jgi:hypothetical protein
MIKELQENAEPQILEVERIFVTSFEKADVLFVKPMNRDTLALELPKEFLEILRSKDNLKK